MRAGVRAAEAEAVAPLTAGVEVALRREVPHQHPARRAGRGRYCWRGRCFSNMAPYPMRSGQPRCSPSMHLGPTAPSFKRLRVVDTRLGASLRGRIRPPGDVKRAPAGRRTLRCGACRLRAAPPGRILNGHPVNAVHGIRTRGNGLMNRTELSAYVAARAAVSKATADSVVSALFATIGEALARDESVTVAGFGTFSTRARAARAGRSPATGESISIGASKTPAFKAGRKLRETVNAGQ